MEMKSGALRIALFYSKIIFKAKNERVLEDNDYGK